MASLEKFNKKELIDYIAEIQDERDRFKKLYGEQTEKSVKYQRDINDREWKIKELKKQIKGVQKLHKMEVASTFRTARFLIDSFRFDTFTHRQKDNLAQRYSEMLKSKEEDIYNVQIQDDDMPF